jgi:hypothetical protein
MKFKRWSCAVAMTLFAAMCTTATWGGSTYSVLHNVGHGNAGWVPEPGLVLDKHRNLCGTTTAGGSGCLQNPGCGIIFELTPDEYCGWTEANIHEVLQRIRGLVGILWILYGVSFCVFLVLGVLYYSFEGGQQRQQNGPRQKGAPPTLGQCVSYRSENDLSMPTIAKTILSATASASGRHDPTPERVGG